MFYERINLSRILETTGTEQENNKIEIPAEYMDDFVKAVKIGYYKELHKQGLLTDEQLAKLIERQDRKKPAA